MQFGDRSPHEIEQMVQRARDEAIDELTPFEGRDFACPRLFWEDPADPKNDGD
jgi:hypothetical protein